MPITFLSTCGLAISLLLVLCVLCGFRQTSEMKRPVRRLHRRTAPFGLTGRETKGKGKEEEKQFDRSV